MAKQKREFVLDMLHWRGNVVVTADIYRDGIGRYEYLGAKCFDHGEWVVDIEEIVPVFTLEDDETAQKQVLDYIDNNFDSLAEKYSNDWDIEE